MHIIDCYQKLELPPTATRDDVRRNYKRLVRHWHPDQFDADSPLKAYAEERLKLINAAYDFICKHYPDTNIGQSNAKGCKGHASAPDTAPVFDAYILLTGFRQRLCTLLAGMRTSWDTFWYGAALRTHRPKPSPASSRSRQKGSTYRNHHKKRSNPKHSRSTCHGKKRYDTMNSAYPLRHGYGVRRRGKSGPISAVEPTDGCRPIGRVHKISPTGRVE